MGTLGTVGRYVFAIPFLVFGAFHFMNASAMAGMVPIPGGAVWVYLTGVAHVAAALAILTGRMAALACALLGVMLLIFAFSIQLPGALGAPDQATMQNFLSSFLKDVGLAGGAWVLAGVFAAGERTVAEG